MRLTADERAQLRKYLHRDKKTRLVHGFSWVMFDRVLTSLDEAEVEITRLRRLLSFAWNEWRRTDCDCEHCEEIRAVVTGKGNGDPS